MVGVEPLHASFHPTWSVTVAMMMIVILIMVMITILISSEYVDELEGRFCELPADSAALFCYFNSLDLFHRYLDNFKGVFLLVLLTIIKINDPGFCVILIGPKDGSRHCEPEPRYLEEECSDAWRLYVSVSLFQMFFRDFVKVLRGNPKSRSARVIK